MNLSLYTRFGPFQSPKRNLDIIIVALKSTADQPEGNGDIISERFQSPLHDVEGRRLAELSRESLPVRLLGFSSRTQCTTHKIMRASSACQQPKKQLCQKPYKKRVFKVWKLSDLHFRSPSPRHTKCSISWHTTELQQTA